MLRIGPTKGKADCLVATIYQASRAETDGGPAEQGYCGRFGLEIAFDTVTDIFAEDGKENFRTTILSPHTSPATISSRAG